MGVDGQDRAAEERGVAAERAHAQLRHDEARRGAGAEPTLDLLDDLHDEELRQQAVDQYRLDVNHREAGHQSFDEGGNAIVQPLLHEATRLIEHFGKLGNGADGEAMQAEMAHQAGERCTVTEEIIVVLCRLGMGETAWSDRNGSERRGVAVCAGFKAAAEDQRA